jgi:hypothetical protein
MFSRIARASSAAARLGLLALALYVTLDCANPLMAGAVRFDPDDCVEAVTHARFVPSAAVAVTASPVATALPGATSRPAPVAAVRRAPAVARADAPRARVALDPVPDTTPDDD